jgi:hypothetical protein
MRCLGQVRLLCELEKEGGIESLLTVQFLISISLNKYHEQISKYEIIIS